jgi:hypothetical protein
MTRFAMTVAMVSIALGSCANRAVAQDVTEITELSTLASPTPIADAVAAEVARLAVESQQTAPRPVAIEYSDGHLMRAKIHKYTSLATLPLLATEFYLGQSLYNDPNSLSSGKRGVHGAVGAGLIGVFGVNSVTGAWNLLESRQAPGHTKRLVHGLLMLASEGGFVASAVTAPGGGRNGLVTFDADKSTHRTIAITSIGLATAGYLMMLFGDH